MKSIKKAIFLFALILISGARLNAQQIFTDALKKAQLENKMLLVNFSGSDWCIPCIQMRKEYFERTSFTNLYADHLIMLNADFPRKKKNMPAADIVRQNEMLAEKYNTNGVFPFTILLNKEGKVLKRWEGKPEETAEEFVENIVALHQKNP